MVLIVVLAMVLAAVVGLTTYRLTRGQYSSRIDSLSRELTETTTALVAAKSDFEARREELRRSIDEARTNVAEAKKDAAESSQRLSSIAEELKVVLEEKGRLQGEAARVEEIRGTLLERDKQINSLNDQIMVLGREKTEALKDSEAANRRAVEMVAKERETVAEILGVKEEQITKLNEFVGHAREVLTTEFKALSADALKDATKQLVHTADEIIERHDQKTDADVKLHEEHIETLLKPVEETIKRLDRHVEDSNVSRSKAEALLDDQVKRLAGASESLSNALRKPVVRGSWGEMTLENALEDAGLEPEIDFILQHSTDAEDGRKRTDAIVNLPKGRKLIIDSKNLMESYLALVNASDEVQRSVLAENHSKLLKAHIKALWAKEYWKRYEGMDCVFLFIPHDGMYHAAIRDEAELIREAYEKRVFVCNPMTLIPLLRAIRYVLDQDRLNQSAEEISKVGTELYGEITRFAANMWTIGDKIKSTVKAYNEAIPGLDRFIVSKSRKLKQLGSAKGVEAELPEAIDVEPKPFSSQELKLIGSEMEENETVSNVEIAHST